MVLPFWLVLWRSGLQVVQTDLKLATYLELILNLWVLLPFLEYGIEGICHHTWWGIHSRLHTCHRNMSPTGAPSPAWLALPNPTLYWAWPPRVLDLCELYKDVDNFHPVLKERGWVEAGSSIISSLACQSNVRSTSVRSLRPTGKVAQHTKNCFRPGGGGSCL